MEADANYQTITRHAFGNKYQPQLRRRLTQPAIDNSGIHSNLRNTTLNNLGVWTVDTTSHRGSQSGISERDMPGGHNDSFSAQGARTFESFASIRRSAPRNQLPRFSVTSPYSVWPNNLPLQTSNNVRNRSRSSSTVSGTILNQINNNLSSSKL